jgi:hypothetical protein
MSWLIGLAILALIAAGCPPAQQLSPARADQPSDVAPLTSWQHRQAGGAAKNLQSAPLSGRAGGIGAAYHQADSRICGELPATPDANPPAALAAPKQTGGPGTPPARQRELHATALALYKATSRDAETFTAALLVPEVRRKVEAALGQKLSDEQCRAMVRQARAEALYWYQYMQGLERADAGIDSR